jgi:hypothetical protein
MELFFFSPSCLSCRKFLLSTLFSRTHQVFTRVYNFVTRSTHIACHQQFVTYINFHICKIKRICGRTKVVRIVANLYSAGFDPDYIIKHRYVLRGFPVPRNGARPTTSKLSYVVETKRLKTTEQTSVTIRTVSYVA